MSDFKCPRCGSDRFGTSCLGYPQGVSVEVGNVYFEKHAVGFCHRPGCGYTSWRRTKANDAIHLQQEKKP